MCYIFSYVLNAVYIFTTNNGSTSEQFRLPKYKLKVSCCQKFCGFWLLCKYPNMENHAPPPLVVVVQPSYPTLLSILGNINPCRPIKQLMFQQFLLARGRVGSGGGEFAEGRMRKKVNAKMYIQYIEKKLSAYSLLNLIRLGKR